MAPNNGKRLGGAAGALSNHDLTTTVGDLAKAAGPSQLNRTEGAAVSALVNYEAARVALAKAVSVDEVKEIHDMAIAMRAYAKQAKDKTLIAQAAEIRSRALRRLGQMMEEQAKTVGKARGAAERGTARGTTRVAEKPASLKEAGIDKNLAHQARRAAEVDDATYEKHTLPSVVMKTLAPLETPKPRKARPVFTPTPESKAEIRKSMEDVAKTPLSWSSRAGKARDLATYTNEIESCPKTQEMLEAVNEVIAAWTVVREHIETAATTVPTGVEPGRPAGGA